MNFDFTLDDVEELRRLARTIRLSVSAGLGRDTEVRTAKLLEDVAQWREEQITTASRT